MIKTINPTCAEFCDLLAASKSPIVPLCFVLANNHFFAPQIFSQIEKKKDYVFLLESADGNNLRNARYSFIGANIGQVVRFADGQGQIEYASGRQEVVAEQDPLSLLRRLHADNASDKYSQLPIFWSGWVGYLGYECVYYMEPTSAQLEHLDSKPAANLPVPEMLWMKCDELIVFDNYKQQIFCIYSLDKRQLPDHEAAAQAYKQTVERFDALYSEYFVEQATPAPWQELLIDEPNAEYSLPQSSIAKDKYLANVEKIVEHIYEGDIFQAVYSQRFELPGISDVFCAYRQLRRLNPSPYMFYLKCNQFTVAGSSPELMCQLIDQQAIVRPIAGSRPRGANLEEDEKLANELRNDPKELAEHWMLVDLGRNDLGRVCELGSVQAPVSRLLKIEQYSHIMHLVSDVVGRLLADKHAIDLIQATFPAGTLSGAPKVRAMQIINQYEQSRRNIYGGMVGWLGGDGNMSSCIAIRTLLAINDKIYVQSGGGIVADSDPEREYQESINKAMAPIVAVELARAEIAKAKCKYKDNQ